MSGWVAVVPRKASGEPKSRLAEFLGEPTRSALVNAMAAHVLDVVARVERVQRVLILGAPVRNLRSVPVLPDCGRGLNAELASTRAALPATSILVVHADLPLLAADDIDALLDAAETSGAALAPDRHGSGTNAVALSPYVPFAFEFGPGSLARHIGQPVHDLRIVDRPGLAIDVDEFQDLELAAAAGARSCREALEHLPIMWNRISASTWPE
jgi:2-phospho-L-lactate guanylyltransferase